MVRNVHGELICARAQWYDHLEDVLMAEAVAVRDGLILAKRCGIVHAIVESNNNVVIRMLQEPEGGRSAITGIWHA
jgi:hypothetical protein